MKRRPGCADLPDPCVRLVIVKPIQMCATHAAAWPFSTDYCTAIIPTEKTK